LTIVTIVYAAD